MALRVLLADESSTIKKVISLALQDFAVDVKVVQSGLDVVEVAKQFNPDIILADVLLQKKNGYEVCFDIKNDVSLTQIPVILMWSSFMDLDEKAFVKSRANAKLEKPFEVEDLRKLMNTFASKTREQAASSYLKFPTNLTEPLKSEQLAKKTAAISEDTFSRLGIPAPPQNSRVSGSVAPPNPPSRSPIPTGKPANSEAKPTNWNMDSFEDIQSFGELDENPANDLNRALEDFSAIKLTPPVRDLDNTVMKDFNLGENLESWEQKDLSKFKIDASDDIDPFSLMDLGKIDVTQVGQKTSPSYNNESPSSGRKNPPATKSAPLDETSYQSFDFADSDAEPLNLELDEVEPPPQQTKSDEAASTGWNFHLPEHDVSPIKPGDIVELPAEFSSPAAEPPVQPPPPNLKSLPPPLPTRSPPTSSISRQALPPSTAIDQALIEKVVREQTRELVEKIIQKILPEMAKQLIQKELDRLLSEDMPS